MTKNLTDQCVNVEDILVLNVKLETLYALASANKHRASVDLLVFAIPLATSG